jgi:hypothetical protein
LSSERVDQLFGGEAGGSGLGGPEPRTGLILGLLVVAAPMDLFGVVCCTSIPGMVLTLAAWLAADADLARVESGHLDVDRAPALVRLKQVAFGLLIWCGATFLIQMALLGNGAYERWLVSVIRVLGSLGG